MLLRFSVSGFNQLTESWLFFSSTFLLFLVAESFLSQDAMCMPRWETVLCPGLVHWSYWEEALHGLVSCLWLGHSEQVGALPVTLQSDRVSWIHRGLQFVDVLGHSKCICEICSIMLFPYDCIWILFLLNHICLIKGNAGACALVVGSPVLVVVRVGGANHCLLC